MAKHYSPKHLAQLTGAAYVLIISAGLWGEFVARGGMDGAENLATLIATEAPRFRAGILADLVMATADIALAVLLFLLFERVHRGLALAAMVFRLIQTAILGANLLLLVAAVQLATGAHPDASLWVGPLIALHASGYDVALVFFGVNSLATGTLIWMSGLFPRVIGAGIFAAGLVYIGGGVVRVMAPQMVASYEPMFLVPLVAEVTFCLALLAAGRFGKRAGWDQSQAL